MDVDDYGPLLTAEAFLEIDFGERIKAELDEGIVSPLIRGPEKRVRAAGNLTALIMGATRGTGFAAYGSSLMVKTAARSVRFPDIAVYARDQRPIASAPDRDLMANPIVAVHVRPMDGSTAGRLLGEYQDVGSMRAVMFVDHETEAIRLVQRTAAGAWLDEHVGDGGEAVISVLDLAIPHSEIFARD